MATLTTLVPGTIFAGDFRVIRPLASGGMGSVYVVEQLSTGKERALKIMDPKLVAIPDLRARFVTEARVASRIESDHVVEVVAAGVDEPTQTPWLAMELLKGETLTERLEKGRMGPVEAIEALRQIGHALGAAHRAGLVHRDIKPDNVFLATARRDGQSHVVKVLDFGIAKALQDARARSVATAAMGTPLWMAPEQTESRGLIGPQTDVWAFGLLAFVMLTGRMFWASANELELSIPAVMREALFDPIPPASVRAAQFGLAGTLPDGFDGWFARAVVRDAAQRFANADEALAALVPLFASVAPLAATAPLATGAPHAPPVARTVAWNAQPTAPAVPSAPIGTARTQLALPPALGPALGPAPTTQLAPKPTASPRGWVPWVAAGALLLAAGAGLAWAAIANRTDAPAPAPAVTPPPVVPSVPDAAIEPAALPPPPADAAAAPAPAHDVRRPAVRRPSTVTDAGTLAAPTPTPDPTPTPTPPPAPTPEATDAAAPAPQDPNQPPQYRRHRFGDGGMPGVFQGIPGAFPGLFNPRHRQRGPEAPAPGDSPAPVTP